MKGFSFGFSRGFLGAAQNEIRRCLSLNVGMRDEPLVVFENAQPRQEVDGGGFNGAALKPLHSPRAFHLFDVFAGPDKSTGNVG